MKSKRLNFVDYQWKHSQTLAELYQSLLLAGRVEVMAFAGNGSLKNITKERLSIQQGLDF